MQKSNYAEVKDVRIKLRKEECASGMGRSTRDAALTDVQNTLRKEVCALDTGCDASLKDAQMGQSEEVCALDTGHIAILKMNPLHSDQNTRIVLLQTALFPISVLLDLHSFFQVR